MSKGDAKTSDLSGMQAFMHQIPKCQELGAKYSIHLDLVQMMIRHFKDRRLEQIASVQQDVSTGIDGNGKAFSLSKIMDEMKLMLMDHSMRKKDLLRTILILATSDKFKSSQIEELLKLGEFGEDETRAAINIKKLATAAKGEGTFFSGLSKRREKKHVNTVNYHLSRWTPVIKQVVVDLTTDRQDEDKYPRMTLSEPDSPFPPMHDVHCGQWSDGLGVSQPRSALPSYSTSKPANCIVVFIIGGVTYSEIKAMYDIMAANRAELLSRGSRMRRIND